MSLTVIAQRMGNTSFQRLVIPVGAGEVQQLMLIIREEHGFSRRVLGAVRFVPLLNGPLA